MAKQSERVYGGDCAYATEDEHARVLFYDGYHDGAQAARMGWTPQWERGTHFAPAYETGYWAGDRDQKAGAYTGHSTEAWDALVSRAGAKCWALRIRNTDTHAPVRPTHAEIMRRAAERITGRKVAA